MGYASIKVMSFKNTPAPNCNESMICITLSNQVDQYALKLIQTAFEPKYRNSDYKTGKDGSHIALFVTRNLITDMGGRLELTSDDSNQTVTAILQFPIST